MATARMFGRERVRFYENGVVSLNLPPSGQVIGSRASRSTHPQVLAGFGRIFSMIFGTGVHVDNPFIWKTKSDVLSTIRKLGAEDLIRGTRSCGEVRKMTRMHSHCGLCSQCIDRRFAVLAEGLEQHDPEEAYAVDPLKGARNDVREREIVLGYVRNARLFAGMDPGDFARNFGEIQRAVGYLDEPPNAAAKRLFLLHQRHGQSVVKALDAALDEVRVLGKLAEQSYHQNSLVMLAGRDVYGGENLSTSTALQPLPNMPESAMTHPKWVLRFNPVAKQATFDGLGNVKGVAAQVLCDLGQQHLDAAGQGLAPEDYPLMAAREAGKRWNLSEEGVRRRISLTRKAIAKISINVGFAVPDEGEVIENVSWRGYRLNPDFVQVIRNA